MAEHLNATNAAITDMLQRVPAASAAAWGGDASHAQAAALKRLWSIAWREAQTQSYADAFLAIVACFAVATVMVPLMRNVAPPKAPSADAH
jgi:MFS transporter, DHA2 family, multidrug resistance protein